MLIEFKVANFRSIREEQIFSLVASTSDKDLPACVIERNLPGLSKVKFLKGAAIYGANASGKSNVVEAIRFLATFVKTSATRIQPGDPTGTTPFKLDQTSESMPSKFEITFEADGVRYLFGLSVSPKRVIHEFLMAYPKGSPQRWYHRVYDEESSTYEWAKPSTAFKHDRDLQKLTRENSLFLSVGPQFNHPQLTPVFDWFRKHLRFLNLGGDRSFQSSFTSLLLKEGRHQDRVMRLLRGADIGITDAAIDEEVFDLEDLLANVPPSLATRIRNNETADEITRLRPRLSHIAKDSNPVFLDYEQEESAGTRRFFDLIGPWLDILENGYTVFVDEIETSLHPILIKELLKPLLHGDTDSTGPQIVFTTHNPILLDNTLLRRDQIWFTEKSPEGCTYLYPLTDYKPRKHEALAKGYLAGRYGGIPYLPDGFDL